MNQPTQTSPLMRIARVPSGRYHLQVGLAALDLGPGDLKKLHRLLKTAVNDYADLLAEDAMGLPENFRRTLPPDDASDPLDHPEDD